MNCLEYALGFWEWNPKYRLWYNSDHVINLPPESSAVGFLPLEHFGYDHIKSSFNIRLEYRELLKKYFRTPT